MKAELLYIQKLTYDENTGNEIIGLFPSEYNPAIVSSYTYDAKRMGGAPTITATIYSSDPLQWKKEEFVEYNGDRFFASYTPNSTKDNSSRMWKSEITFTSRRELLDNTLFFDVVVDDVDTQNKDIYRSNQTKFTFGGTIYEFVARINSSMAYCELYRPTDEYKGYYVVVDEGYGTDEVKEVSFENQYLTDVLQLINTTFELNYYWDGNVCHVGKVQQDLTDTPIKYGSSDALISVSKENANYKIVDMITGYGSSDNLPYYYPNDDEFGEAVFNTENFSKSLVLSISLGDVLKWNSDVYNNTLVLCKNSKDSYTANVFGTSSYLITNFGGKEYKGKGEESKNVIPTCSMGEKYTEHNFSSVSRLIGSATIWTLFEFNSSAKEDTVKMDGLSFVAKESDSSIKFGLEFSYEYAYYVGENTNIDTAYKSIQSVRGGGSMSGEGGGSFGNGDSDVSISKRWAFGDNIDGLSNYTKSSKKEHTFERNSTSTIVIACKITATNIEKASGTRRMNTVSTSISGSIELTRKPSSVYYFETSDGHTKSYDESGIKINGIGDIPHKDLTFSFDGTYWNATEGGENNAAKITITDRVWLAPSSVLMPSIYRNTKGAERFYYALNNIHKLPSGSGYYEFVNLYKKGNPHQGTVTFDDIKPTINGIVNAEGQLFGEIADVAFDSNDSDVKDSDGKYIHNYFYIKLHKFNGEFGFDLFNHVLAKEPAKINLIKSNGCPACSFVIHNQPSADNSKCYNCVSVDENGNLKQVRTDKNDYIFANASDTYEDKLNQDSTQKELWIAVQKDTSTLGIVMPNASAGFKPQKGDLFVITGIKPPKVLVTAAEKRLDDALIKHMSENNTDQFNYSVKFSRIFLQENPDFASKLNENAKLSIQVQGDSDSDGNLISHEVFVSNYSVKVDNDELAEVEVELVNSLEVTKSDTKQIIDAVKGETVKSLSIMVGGSNTNSFNASITDKMYLSKLKDDTANGKITFIKGLIAKGLADLMMGAKFGNSANITELGDAFFRAIKSLDYDNAAEQGFSVEKEKNGKYHAFFTNLTIWGKAIFHELEVRKLSYSGGNIYLSGAGSKLIKVVPVKKLVSADGVTSWVETTENDVERFGWKCYLLADNGTTATMNYWQEGDQVRCQTMGEIVSGGTYQNVSNKSYWRTIPNGGVSTQNEKIYGTKTETYIDEDGNEQTRDVQVELYDGQAFAWIVIGKHSENFDGYTEDSAPDETKDIPAEGDTIVLDGNRHRDENTGKYDKTDRQNVIILETTGEYAPRIACYANITEYKHTITKSVNGSDKEVSLSVFETSPKGGTKINSSRFEWISDDGSTINIINYRGDWVRENTYHKNDQVNHNNAVWVCIANSGVDVTEEPSDGATYWKKVLSGVKGDDGKTPQPTGSAETYYAITSSPSTEPDDSSWMPTPIDTSKHQGKFLWTDNRTEWKIGDKTEWISNKTCSYIGKDGSNGTSVSIKGSLSDIGELPVSGNVNGDSYLIDGYLWIYTGTSVDDDNQHNGFENVGKIKGEDGISATQYYYHVAWMNTSDNSDNSFTTTNPSGSSYAYIGTLIDTTDKDSDDYTKYDWAYVKGDRGEDGKNAVRIDLTNESSTVTCDKDGNIIGTIQGTVAILYDGAKEADINNVSYSISSYKGLSSMPTISEGGVISGLSVSGGKTSLEASINIKAVYKNQDYYATYTITKVLAGSDGTPATTYWIEPSATAIKVDSDGNANPSTITCRQYKQVGAESPVAGDKKIYYRHNRIDSTLWNEYTEAIIPAVNVEAYEFILADRIPSNSHAIIYDRESIPVVKDGQNGNDAVLFRLYLSKSSVNYATDSGINNIYVYVMQTIGGKNSRTLIANMQKLCKAKFYVEYVNKDGSVIKEYRDGTTGIINSNSRFDTLAYAQLAPTKFYIDLVSADDDSIVIDTKEVIVVNDGEQGESALEIIVTPETLVFDTNDYGIVPPETSKQASISCYRNGVKVTNVSYSKSAEKNCSASVSDSNSSATVTISRITSQEVADTSGNSSTISNTSGYATIQVWDKDTNLYHRVQVKFMVNVAKFTGQMVNTNKRFSLKHEELSNAVKDKVGSSELKNFKAEITQTAREISLSVSEKSVGRRNLLVGSAFLREDNHVEITDGVRIEMNSGYQETNCIHSIDETDGTPHYRGAFWDGSQGGKSIKITKGKKYVLSCYYKTNDANGRIFLEALYTDEQTNAKRTGNGPTYLTQSNFVATKLNQWELFTTIIDTTNAGEKDNYLAFNFFEHNNGNYGRIDAYICRPMVEEGDTYNGWTLSQDDYDIIGANLIDNSRTLDTGGNVIEAKGRKALVGDAYELTYIGSDDYNTFYRIKGSTFQLGVDYTISFEVRGDAKYMGVYAYYPITNTKFTFYAESQNGAMTEVTDGGNVDNYVALIQVKELSKQQRVWSHFRFKDRLPEQIYFQFPKNADQIGVTSWSVTITRPKIEVGAVVTEYTERKSDLIDKASLKAAGIEITSNMVELYGNQVKVSGAKGGTPVAMFENGMLNSNLINADKIMARQLQTTGSNGQSVSIENGLMRVYGTNGRCNIEFGVNSNGEAILSYYDMNGKWLYDLGPNKLDGGQLKESTLDGDKYVTAVSFFGTNNFFSLKTYINVTVKQVDREYSQRLFGNNLFFNDDQEIANNNAAHMGYKPFERVSTSDVTTLYRYTAPRQSGTIIKDERYRLTTPALAKQADGKYFTSNSVLAINGKLANLAPAGCYFRKSEQVRMAPYPMLSTEIQQAKFPAYSIRCLNITSDGTGAVMSGFNEMMSYLMRTIKN